MNISTPVSGSTAGFSSVSDSPDSLAEPPDSFVEPPDASLEPPDSLVEPFSESALVASSSLAFEVLSVPVSPAFESKYRY